MCLDLVSFFANVSCVKLGLDPLKTKLAVVSDTNKPGSVVLAATKPLKQLGIKQDIRLYKIKDISGIQIDLVQLHTGEPIRSISVSLTNLVDDGEEQISIFDDMGKREQEIKLTKVINEIRTKYGKNSILRAISFTPHSTTRYRNTLIGGHRA